MIPPIYSYLSPITPNVFQDEADENASAPYVVWSLLTAVPENNLSQSPPGDRMSISVDVFARTEAERDAITAACRAAIEAHGHVLTMQSLGREEDTRLWRMTFDADVFHPR